MRRKVPLVVHLHGAGGCATLPSLGWWQLAEQEVDKLNDGLVVVWPQGTKHTIPFLPDFIKNFAPKFILHLLGLRVSCWNDGSQLFGAEEAGIDDHDSFHSTINSNFTYDKHIKKVFEHFF